MEVPFICGQEGSSTVAQVLVKTDAQGIKLGNRVSYSGFGSYTADTPVPSSKLMIPAPAEIGLDVATSPSSGDQAEN